jgi:hypothetical protein
LIFEIGDLSDIAQSCKPADLNGLLEINFGYFFPAPAQQGTPASHFCQQ